MSSRRSRSLTDYYRAAMRRKLLLVTPALVLAIATGAALAKLPILYKSTAILSLANPKTAESDRSSQLNEVRQKITSPEALDAVLVKYSRNDQSIEAATAKMRQRISIDEPQPGAFAFSYRAEDPETTRKITNEMANQLVPPNLTGPSASDSGLEALRKRAADISSRLRDLEAKDPRLPLEADSPAIAPAQPVRSAQPSAEIARAQQMTIEGLKDQQYKFQQELVDVERRIIEQRQIVDQQSKGSALRDNPTYAVLIARRTDLQGQRDTLINRQELTDKHPRVLAINDQIAAINRQIDELRRQDAALVSQSPEARELASLSSERNRLKIELEVTGRELARRSSNQSVLAPPDPQPARRDVTTSKLAQEYLGLRRSQKEITAEIQDAEVRARQDVGASSQLRLLQPADLPTHPISPARTLLISVASILGLALGAAFALVAESTRFNSLQDARDVEYYTRLPLLGSIPKMTIAQERRSARWRATARLVFGTAAALAVTLALTRFFIATDILALITKN